MLRLILLAIAVPLAVATSAAAHSPSTAPLHEQGGGPRGGQVDAPVHEQGGGPKGGNAGTQQRALPPRR